jgi:RND family efflux transporter MFP subunit
MSFDRRILRPHRVACSRKVPVDTMLPIRLACLTLATSLAGTAVAQSLDCVIEPSKLVRLGAPIPGLIVDVAVARGERVRSGDLVARIEARVEQASVALLEAQAMDEAAVNAQRARLTLALQRRARADSLLEREAIARDAHEEIVAEQAVAEAELQRAESAQRVAMLELARAKARLALHEIRSPIDGIVLEGALSAGEFATTEEPVATIAGIDPLHVEVYPPVEVYERLALGQTAMVMPSIPRGAEAEATITVIDTVFDPTSNTFGVRLALDNPSGQIPAGQRCRVELAPGD